MKAMGQKSGEDGRFCAKKPIFWFFVVALADHHVILF